MIACGSGATTSATTASTRLPVAIAAGGGSDWPEFGGNPQRSDASNAPTGITAANVAGLPRRRIDLPGTVDSSPIYLHGVSVAGGAHDVFIVTTTYGRTLALDASDGHILWQFTPHGIGGWEGSYQVTNASPAADPDRRYVYAASPDGRIHKLALTDGHEAAGWPVRVTLDSAREKLGGSLGVEGSSVIAVTGGYIGDAPPYQGHVVAISRASGRVTAVFNSLCDGRHHLIVPSSCASSDSAIWARGGAVTEPGSGRLLVGTGNGPYNGRSDFGDSVVELDFRSLHRRQSFTPTNQADLNTSDTDLGSAAPAILPGGLVLAGGKDGILRLRDQRRLDGRAVGTPARTGGELQTLSGPGGSQLLAQPAVWGNDVFVATSGGTAAYVVRGRRLHLLWQNGHSGSSPIVAGGLLYVYDVAAGELDVYRPSSGRRVAALPAGGGHWNSPVIAGGRIALGEGNVNDQSTHGVLDLYG